MQQDLRGGDKWAGGALIAAGALIPAAMMHHPNSPSASLVQPVHAAMMAVSLVMFWAIVRFAVRLGLHRPAPLLGLILYGAGTGFGLVAATLNGFALPRLAARSAGPLPADLFWALNQSFAQAGIAATAASFLAFAAGWLARSHGAAWRPAAILLAAMGAAPAVLLLAGTIELDVHGALAAYALQSFAAALAGFWMVRAER